MAGASSMDIRLFCANTAAYPDTQPRLLTVKRGQALPIGRASHNNEKNLRPSDRNASFDCPVMSRRHAELNVDPRSGCPTIKDAGSMHGTLLNGKLLDVNRAYALKSGDRLTFGSDVTRGQSTHKGIKFDVEFPVTHTFSVPYSEGEEDVSEDGGLSEQDDQDDQDTPTSRDKPLKSWHAPVPDSLPFAASVRDLDANETVDVERMKKVLDAEPRIDKDDDLKSSLADDVDAESLADSQYTTEQANTIANDSQDRECQAICSDPVPSYGSSEVHAQTDQLSQADAETDPGEVHNAGVRLPTTSQTAKAAHGLCGDVAPKSQGSWHARSGKPELVAKRSWFSGGRTPYENPSSCSNEIQAWAPIDTDDKTSASARNLRNRPKTTYLPLSRQFRGLEDLFNISLHSTARAPPNAQLVSTSYSKAVSNNSHINATDSQDLRDAREVEKLYVPGQDSAKDSHLTFPKNRCREWRDLKDNEKRVEQQQSTVTSKEDGKATAGLTYNETLLPALSKKRKAEAIDEPQPPHELSSDGIATQATEPNDTRLVQPASPRAKRIKSEYAMTAAVAAVGGSMLTFGFLLSGLVERLVDA